MSRHRIYAGSRIRALRTARQLKQADMAALLGISTSYLSQIEHDDRPLTAALLASLADRFPGDWQPVEAEQVTGRIAALTEALSEPVAAGPGLDAETLHRFAEQQPVLAERMIALHAAYRQAEEQVRIHDDTLASGVGERSRLPWEEVRDWFHGSGNYVGVLDEAARAVLTKAGKTDADIDWLIPHQANIRIMQSTARKLKLPMDKVVVTVDQHGNTSAASIPLALDHAVRAGQVKKGDTLLLEGVGGGFTWGAVVLKF